MNYIRELLRSVPFAITLKEIHFRILYPLSDKFAFTYNGVDHAGPFYDSNIYGR